MRKRQLLADSASAWCAARPATKRKTFILAPRPPEPMPEPAPERLAA